MTPLPSTISQTPTITQNADVRYLGRLLGDVIRSYGGQAQMTPLVEISEAIATALRNSG